MKYLVFLGIMLVSLIAFGFVVTLEIFGVVILAIIGMNFISQI